MRSLIALLLTLWLAPAWAQVPMTGAGKGTPTAAITFSLAYQDHQEEAGGGTTVNYTTVGIGATDTNRYVAVGIWARMATVNTISSVTICGVSGTLVTGTVAQVGGTNGSNSAIYISSTAITSGTTCTISVTYGAATARTAIKSYRIVTGAPTATSSNATTGNTNLSLTIPSGGSGFAISGQTSTNSAYSWANATLDNTATAGGTSGVSSATVSATSAAINGGVVIAAQVTSGAAWGP